MKFAFFSLLFAVLLFNAEVRAQEADHQAEFRDLSQRYGDAVVGVRFVMSVTASGKEERVEDRTQALLVAADGLLLVPDRAVSVDFGTLYPGGSSGPAPVAKSAEFRVQLVGDENWLDADLVTRDSQLGLAWLRIRKSPPNLPFVNLDNATPAQPGMVLYTLMRTSDELGSTLLIRPGRVIGKTGTPRSLYLVDGLPGLAFAGDGKVLGFVDFDFPRLLRSRSGSSGLALDSADAVLQMTPIEKVAAATKLAASLPVKTNSP